MANISEKLVTIAENSPKVYHAGQMNVIQSAKSLKGFKSSTSILLDDVSPAEHTMSVRVHGKNLLNPNIYAKGYTFQGITFSVSGDVITMTGTALKTSYTNVVYQGNPDGRIVLPDELMNRKIKLYSYGNTSPVEMVLSNDTSSKPVQVNSIIDTTGYTKFALRLRFTLGVTYNDTIRIMICDESISDNPAYEPYNSDIQNVHSKNLIVYPYIHTTKTEKGITFTDNGDGSITISGKAESNVYFYLCKVDFGSNNMWNETANNNGYYVSGCKHFFYNGANKVSSIIIPSETDYSTNTITVKPQIEYGSTATTYTKYHEPYPLVVSKYGKNLFDISSSRGFESVYSGLNNTINGNTLEVVCTATARTGHLELGTFPEGTYTFSYNESYNMAQTIMTGSDIPNLRALGSNFRENTKTFTLLKESKVWVRNTGFSNNGITVTFSNIQLELNSIATDYEPYNSKTDYTPNADGTVEGVERLYPSTTLLTNDPYNKVIIDCNYYKDVDKAYNKLSGAIALSGGE